MICSCRALPKMVLAMLKQMEPPTFCPKVSSEMPCARKAGGRRAASSFWRMVPEMAIAQD